MSSLASCESSLLAAPQIIVEKQMLDPFSNPNLHALLDRLAAGRYLVYGLVTEYCIASAAFGLLERQAHVELVTDATEGLNREDQRLVIERFQAQGGRLTTVSEVLGRLR